MAQTRMMLNLRLRPQDDAAIERLRSERGESVSDLIRRLIHDAHERFLRERDARRTARK